MSPEPVQPSLMRMRRFEIKPRRKLGQNFLIDNNILDVIATAAVLGPEDVVLEVGGGLGALTEHLAARSAHTHVIEIDKTLEAALQDAIGVAKNVNLILADAVNVDLTLLRPSPTKLVANLPYGIAATTVIKAFYELPDLEMVCVMAQREVATRMAAGHGGKLYGSTSVLVQAVSQKVSVRKLSRNIFYPVPNVDSSLLVLRRTRQNPATGFADLVHQAFAHRRKPIAGSIALAHRDAGEQPGIKERVVTALAQLDAGSNTRAEQLTPTQFLALHRLLDLERKQ